MADKLALALKKPVEVDEEDGELASATRQLSLARGFFWNGQRLRAGVQPCPSGLEVEVLPLGATIDGVCNPKFKKD